VGKALESLACEGCGEGWVDIVHFTERLLEHGDCDVLAGLWTVIGNCQDASIYRIQCLSHSTYSFPMFAKTFNAGQGLRDKPDAWRD
jgi:hypothetical protein